MPANVITLCRTTNFMDNKYIKELVFNIVNNYISPECGIEPHIYVSNYEISVGLYIATLYPNRMTEIHIHKRDEQFIVGWPSLGSVTFDIAEKFNQCLSAAIKITNELNQKVTPVSKKCTWCQNDAGDWLQYERLGRGAGICVECVEKIKIAGAVDDAYISERYGLKGIHWG
jgi:hypothetical protein